MEQIYITVLLCLLGTASSNLIVNTCSGPVQGVSSLEEDTEAFLGIPYAEPPVGDLRFAKPVNKRQWTDIHDASSLPPPCPQFDVDQQYYFMPDITKMSEDCLYLNIWAPKAKSNSTLRPVIIFIHPGGFVSGSSNLPAHDGSRLASRGDLVIATINYRLGSFGFFLGYTEEANGNMGIFDQIMAIEWVKGNAKFFGGDPENIILMGSSAGGFSISMHMVSPLTKGLFKKAIIQSGSAVHPFYMDNNTMLFENSQRVASLLGCTNETLTLDSDPKAVVKCLKSRPIEAFVEAEKSIFENRPVVFNPRVNDEYLPTKSAVDFFREGRFRDDLSVMVGFTKQEGALLLMAILPGFFGNYGKNYENNLNRIRSTTITKAMLLSINQSNSSEILNFYLKQVKNKTSAEYTKMLVGIVGDFSIDCGSVFLADFLSVKENRVYFYKFDFHPASSPFEEWMGTTHLDELQYILGNPYHSNFTAEELELSHRLMDRWSAFAWTGNPNVPGEVPWLQYSHDKPLYLNFEQEEESIRMKPNRRCEFWRKRFNSYLASE